MSPSARSAKFRNGTWEFRLRASSFCSGAKGTKKPPGEAHGHLTMPYPASPGPPVFLRGSHQGARLYPTGAGKRQDTAPRAARCRSVLVERVYTPTRAIAPGFLPSRGDSVVASPPRLVQDTQNCREHAPVPGPHPPAASSTADLSRRWTFQVTVPRGVHPIGGTAVPPVLGRFKGMGYLGEGGNRNPPSPRQLFGDFLSAQKVTRPGAKYLFSFGL